MEKNNWVKALTPHGLAVILFTVLTYAYFFPLLKGMEMAAHDVVQSLGMQQEVKSYLTETGEFSLWTNSMFGGMPMYQIWAEYPGNLFTNFIYFSMFLFPETANAVFLFMLGFYILLFTTTRNPWISVIGAIAFAFSSYNFINIDAGHTTKAFCIALMAPILAGAIMAYNGRYLFGAALTLLFLATQVRSNHFQITYYTFIAGGVLTLFYLIQAFREKQLPNFLKATGVLVVAVIFALGSCTSQLWTTYEYSKETIRGGNSELTAATEKNISGLDKDYAFSWSYGKFETFTLLIPNFMGGASQEELSEGSPLYKDLVKKGVPKTQAEKIITQVPTYWGTQPFTSGPTYFGAITSFLFLLGLFLIRNPIKWALLAIFVLTVFLSWGKNFPTLSDILFFADPKNLPNFFHVSLTDLFFNYFPLYNKFRTPAMILTVANLVCVFMAGLAIKELVDEQWGKNEIFSALKKSLGISLGLIFVAGIIGSYTYDFTADVDTQLEKSGWPVQALRESRADLMRTDAIRSFIFIGLAGLLVWGFLQENVKKTHFLIGLGLLMLFDLWPISKRYLDDSDFIPKSDKEKIYRPTKADAEILQDKDPNYRVLNLTTSTFNDSKTSYLHKSVGGYHAAKIRRYQDLIERQITKNMQVLNKGLTNENIPVLNMLNMKYIIASNDNAVQNPYAMGNAWFVPSYKIVNGAQEEMSAMDNFDPANEAIADVKFKDYLSGFVPQAEPEASILLTDYKPNHLAYKSKTGSEQLAVFSEIYYDDQKGWEAYVDGQPAKHICVNYVLRAMRIPTGEHTIEFKFYPKSYYLGEKISLGFSSLGLLIIVLAFALEIKKSLKPELAEETPTRKKPS